MLIGPNQQMIIEYLVNLNFLFTFIFKINPKTEA
jgi:hypothetical protein